ncbi:hypothetical protein G9A89_022895 [Geosiphon pyriformis]|nr:hypothetical protein G9A89_022895 [Geosiphon pyriformis]
MPKDGQDSSFVEESMNGVLTNTHPIALLETACKIISKILSDQISLVCSKFGVLCEDNFSILRGTSIQSSIFAVGSVMEDALEKGKEIWLVLQDMCKTYDSVGWHHLETSLWHIKICGRFIEFFGGIHKDRLNYVITDFGLSDGYQVLNGLNQSKVFSLFFWQIFYNLLLCEIKRQESIYGYRINTKYVAKLDRINNMGGMTFFFAAGVFVDNTILVGSSQAATQFILDIASEFFAINNISINNDKMVAISINQRVQKAVFKISGLPILIAKHDVSHKYLGIFLLTDGLSKPSLAKA